MRYCLIIMILGTVLQSGGCRKPNTAGPTVNSPETTVASEGPKASSAAPEADKSRDANEIDSTVVAYYFHRTIRCPTCLAIEANVARVIEDDFSQQVADGSLIWIPFNLDDPGGEEFEKEFDVYGSTLVLAKRKDDNHTKYKKLEKVWDFVGNPAKFDEYVISEVERFLNE